MKLVVDAVAVRPGSAAIVIGNTLLGWAAAFPEDEITVLVDGTAQFPVPDSARVVALAPESASLPARLRAQSLGVRRACKQLGADALLSAISASSFLGARCPSATIVYDLRHELRPDQFPRSRRIARKVMYGWSFRRADALFCISERTRGDLTTPRPRLSGKAVTTLLGADHATDWRPDADDAAARYVLAFGHFPNKNVDGVLRAWARRGPGAADLRLRICGLGRAGGEQAQTLVRDAGVQDSVDLLPWQSDEQFRSLFAGASAIVFPSDFEGFGLPAVEAMLLGVPVVISDDPALVEVTAGHAEVASDDTAPVLAAALDRALARTPDQLDAARRHAGTFTWTRTARTMRARLLAER